MRVLIVPPVIRAGKNILAVRASDAFALETYLNVSVTLKDALGCSTAVYAINGIPPSDDGSFQFIGGGGVAITSGPNRIFLSSTMESDNICFRPGAVGNPGPQGPAGPGGAPGATPPNQCCDCELCEKCNTCDNCNTSEGKALCGAADLIIREKGCTLAEEGTPVTEMDPSDIGPQFSLILPYTEPPCIPQ